MTIQELHENTIDLCSRLIQAKSYSGEEREVVGVIEREMRRLGYDEVTVDEYGNVIGCLRGPGRRPARPARRTHRHRTRAGAGALEL